MATGSLQEKNGNYYIVVSYKDEYNKWKVKWVKTGLGVDGNKRRAQEMLNIYMESFDEKSKTNAYNPIIDNGFKNSKSVPLAEEKILFADFIESWVERHKSQVEPTTYAAYKVSVNSKIAPYFRGKNISLQDLTAEDIETFYTHRLKTVKANTVKHDHAYIRKCLQYAFEKGLIVSNPADKVQKPRVEQYMTNYYNASDLMQLFKFVEGKRIELPVILASYYGLRRGEVLGLKWNAIDFEYKTITIKHTVSTAVLDGKETMIFRDRLKTKKSYRTLPLVSNIEEILRKKKLSNFINSELYGSVYNNKYSEYICTDEIGELLKPNFLTQNFKIIINKNELKSIRFHDLRHSCATLLRHQGVPMEDIQKWLGHSNITTTEKIYAHFEDERHWNSANKILSALNPVVQEQDSIEERNDDFYNSDDETEM